MSARTLLIVTFTLVSTVIVCAQNPLAANAISTINSIPGLEPTLDRLTIVRQVNEVNMLLSVTNRHGRFVEDLSQSDLVISDNGQPPEKITYFQRQTDLPLRVALVVDVSDSERYYLGLEQQAVQSFLKKILRADIDSALVVAFNQNAMLLQGPTSNLPRLKSVIRGLKSGGETSVFDAVALAADQLRAIPDSQPVRRVIVLVTDGADNRSKIGLDDAIQSVLRAESVLYSIDTKDTVVSDEDKKADHVTKYLADATGGRMFKVKESSDVSVSFKKIQQELRSQYAIGYRPSHLLSGLFRTVQIFGPKGIQIRHRAGYYSH